MPFCCARQMPNGHRFAGAQTAIGRRGITGSDDAGKIRITDRPDGGTSGADRHLPPTGGAQRRTKREALPRNLPEPRDQGQPPPASESHPAACAAIAGAPAGHASSVIQRNRNARSIARISAGATTTSRLRILILPILHQSRPPAGTHVACRRGPGRIVSRNSRRRRTVPPPPRDGCRPEQPARGRVQPDAFSRRDTAARYDIFRCCDDTRNPVKRADQPLPRG